MKPIAHIFTDLPEKFGIPRQSNLVPALTGHIIFEPEYRDPQALRGLEDYDYLWLLWEFQVPEQKTFQSTVRPPRLGGNTHVGVFATRSPFRPNPIGLSSVKLEDIQMTNEGPVILVSGVDMRNGTPIYDIKPYLPYVDSHPDAKGGFSELHKDHHLQVIFPEHLMSEIPAEKQTALIELLGQDPRPSYQKDPDRIYGIAYSMWNIRFQVNEDTLTVIAVEERTV